jgi:hypothetical protein
MVKFVIFHVYKGCASECITCYLIDIWFHTDPILWTFGLNRHSAILDTLLSQFVR